MKPQTKSIISILFFLGLLSTFSGSSLWAEDGSGPANGADAASAPAVLQESNAAATNHSLTAPTNPVVTNQESLPSSDTSAEDAESHSEFRPEVQITKAGDELNIKITYSHPMDAANQNMIEYVRMETLKGEFLGLSSMNDKATQATATFTINTKLANFDTVRLVAKSTKVGLIKSIHKLEISETKTQEAKASTVTTSTQPAPEIKPQTKEPSKKKRWGLF